MLARSSIAVALGCVGCTPNAFGLGSADDTSESSSTDPTGPSTFPTDETNSDPSLGTGSQTATGSDTATDTDPTAASTSDGSCVVDDDCSEGYCLGDTCVSVASCQQLEMLDDGAERSSGVYELDPDGPGDLPPYSAYCELDLVGGGWTLVLKALGPSDTFEYDSELWTNELTHQPAFSDLDRNEAKLASYVHVPVSEILMGMEYPIGSDPDPPVLSYVVLPVEGESLHALVSPGTRIDTKLGRNAWKGLVTGSSLQPFCNREGINVHSDTPGYVGQRIGIIANDQMSCDTPDSRIGVGGRGGNFTVHCGTEALPHGNFAGCGSDAGSVSLPAYVVVMVR